MFPMLFPIRFFEASVGVVTSFAKCRLRHVRARSRRESAVRSFPLLEAPGMKKFFRSEDGIAVTEYGLLIALVAIALIAVVTIFGSQISTWFSAKTGQITTV